MSSAGTADHPRDEDLVAYLDGELSLSDRQSIDQALSESADLRQRLEQLRQGGRPFREAFDTLLDQAPMDRLMAALPEPTLSASVISTSKATPPRPANDWQSIGVAAMLLLTLGIGFAVGYGTSSDRAGEREVALLAELDEMEAELEEAEAAADAAPVVTAKGWRQAVADYQMLFTTESLTPDQGGGDALALASERVGLPLDPATRAASGLQFRRAQLLAFKDKPLVQLAYLGDDGVPVAFCIIASNKPEAETQYEVRNGLGIVHWIIGGYGLMVIGDLPEDRLNRIASDLRKSIDL
ncbi:MAG: membrane protein [Minwuia thermotolerans]|nr:MAG: membrane protein [Minwuia thermotolerans]